MVVSLPVYNFTLGLVMRSRKRRFRSIAAIAIASAMVLSNAVMRARYSSGLSPGLRCNWASDNSTGELFGGNGSSPILPLKLTVGLSVSATRSEQIGEGRTVGACRRMEVFDNSASMSGLLLRVCKMQIQFREAELPVDLRPRKLEVVF